MRAKIIAVTLALSVAWVVFAADPAPTTSASSVKKKAATKKTVASKSATGKTATSKTKGKTSAASKQKSKQVVARRPSQTQPSTDRYKEIQQALADKGYFNGAVDGSWGTDSVESLKRFQRDQNIGDDGKLGSLSLIALGLGPKRDLTGTCAAAPCGRGSAAEPRP